MCRLPIDCIGEKEVVAPKLDTRVHGYKCGPRLSPRLVQMLGTCRRPSLPTPNNRKALASIEPLQIVTMTLSVYYVPESTSQIIISTQGKDTVYKELSSQTTLFEV